MDENIKHYAGCDGGHDGPCLIVVDVIARGVVDYLALNQMRHEAEPMDEYDRANAETAAIATLAYVIESAEMMDEKMQNTGPMPMATALRLMLVALAMDKVGRDR